MILRNAEKPDLTNTRTVRVCQKVRSTSSQVYEKPDIYGISRKTAYGMDFS